jgi:hypothetical protein
MITKNNWIGVTSLSTRAEIPTADFMLTINPYPFKKLDFEVAVELTIKEISSKYTNLYLALSGGYDSEFILRTCHKFNVGITPVIVCYSNDEETKYAFEVCDELNVTPVKITLTDDQFLNYLNNKISKQLNGSGYNFTHVLFAADYVEKNNGTLLTGFNLLGDGDDIITDINFASLYEWDFYLDYTHTNLKHIDMFLYTMELACSMLPSSNGSTWQEYKHTLFNIKYRNKARPKYSQNVISQMKKILGTPGDYRHKQTCEWTREEFEQIFKSTPRQYVL